MQIDPEFEVETFTINSIHDKRYDTISRFMDLFKLIIIWLTEYILTCSLYVDFFVDLYFDLQIIF